MNWIFASHRKLWQQIFPSSTERQPSKTISNNIILLANGHESFSTSDDIAPRSYRTINQCSIFGSEHYVRKKTRTGVHALPTKLRFRNIEASFCVRGQPLSVVLDQTYFCNTRYNLFSPLRWALRGSVDTKEFLRHHWKKLMTSWSHRMVRINVFVLSDLLAQRRVLIFWGRRVIKMVKYLRDKEKKKLTIWVFLLRYATVTQVP